MEEGIELASNLRVAIRNVCSASVTTTRIIKIYFAVLCVNAL